MRKAVLKDEDRQTRERVIYTPNRSIMTTISRRSGWMADDSSGKKNGLCFLSDLAH